MPVTRLPLLAASGAVISAACLAVMAVTAVSMGYFGPGTAVVAPADPAYAPARLVVPTPPSATPAR
jgi:hypothetical protein